MKVAYIGILFGKMPLFDFGANGNGTHHFAYGYIIVIILKLDDFQLMVSDILISSLDLRY